MSANKDGAIELPAHPVEKEFEEHIAAYFQCAGFYVERNIVERDVKEVLELDIIATDYDGRPPGTRLVEIKSGINWGFPDIFKVYGWLKYLDISHGALIVKEAKESAEAQQFYQDKAKTLKIDLLMIDSPTKTNSALQGLLGTTKIDAIDHSQWRFSNWIERNLIKRLISRKKTIPTVKRFSAMDEYLFAVNSGVFFTQGAVNRAQKLYDAFQKHPRISAKCAHEELGHDFDVETPTIDNGLFKRTFYDCEYTDLQISTYIEHRARLAILKCAIDYLIYERAGLAAKAGATIKKLLGFDVAAAPESFLDGLNEIGKHKHFHRYPVFWQWFFWFFGGFILKDYEKADHEALSTRTGIPVDAIPEAFSSYGILFPQPGGWFRDEPKSNLRVMKMFPVPFMGIGANGRRALHAKDRDYEQLTLTGQFTRADLIKWNNLAVEVLRKQ